MTEREIEFIFPRRGARISAGLLDDLAPETCETVWSILQEGDVLESVKEWPEGCLVRNARHAVPELFLLLPIVGRRPIIENQTFRPIPGDIMFIMIDSPNPDTQGMTGKGFWEVALFYDRNADLEVRHAPGVEGKGWVGSRFAKVPNAPERIVLRRKTEPVISI